jgi:F-type H+-transporting ATPase subunit gamma
VVITSDKGLCGALNTNLVEKDLSEPISVRWSMSPSAKKDLKPDSSAQNVRSRISPIKDPAKFVELRRG